MGFSRQESWSGLPFPSPGDLPSPGIQPGFPALQVDSLPSKPPGKATQYYKAIILLLKINNNFKKKTRSDWNIFEGHSPEGCACGQCQEDSLPENLRTQVPGTSPILRQGTTGNRVSSITRWLPHLYKKRVSSPCAACPAHLAECGWNVGSAISCKCETRLLVQVV